MYRVGRALNVLYRLTTEMGNVEVARIVPKKKTTLNVLYRLTTEMGNVKVARIVPACHKGKDNIKCTL